jgi:hypothetical protein
MNMFRFTKPADAEPARGGAFAGGLGTLPTGVATGLAAGTKVATSIGWRPVEMVIPGDRVLTFDHGLQVVTSIGRGLLWAPGEACPRHLWPLAVPVGALGNAQAMLLLPEQPVVVESDVGEELYGDPFTLVPAAALAGFRGIRRIRPDAEQPVVTLHFERDQVVFASAGALFFCPSTATATLADLLSGMPGDYTVLGREDARFLLGCLKRDEREAGEGRPAAA